MDLGKDDFIKICRIIELNGIDECTIIGNPKLNENITFTPVRSKYFELLCELHISLPEKISYMESLNLQLEKGIYANSISIAIKKSKLIRIQKDNDYTYTFFIQEGEDEVTYKIKIKKRW